MSNSKVMLVTGAAKRIGASLAKKAHSDGFKIVLHYRQSKTQTQELCDQLNTIRPDSCLVIQADFNEKLCFKSELKQIIETFGRLDVLVNNASDFFKTDILDFNENDFDELFNSNVKGPLFLAKSCFPYLKKTNGCIINLVDIHADKPLKNYPLYSMSKAANKMMVMALAKEMAPKVRVNGISPGCILWPEKELEANNKTTIIDRTALKSLGESEHIYQTLKLLITNSFVTGEIIKVDGGRHLHM